MSPVKLHIDGDGQISRQPERAIVKTRVSKSDQDQKKTVDDVRKAVQEIHARIQPLAARNADGTAQADTAILRWSSSSMSTSKFLAPEDEEHAVRQRSLTPSPQKLVTRYSASVSITTRFRDFEKLSEFTQYLAVCPLASVEEVEWVLTDETEKKLRAEVIKAAYDDSREKAMALTRAMGLEKVKPIEIRNQSWFFGSMDRAAAFGNVQAYAPPPPRRRYRSGQDGDELTLSYLPEDVRCSTQVQVEFQAE